MAEIEFAGYLRNNAGTPIVGATVELFDAGTTTPLRNSANTNAAGKWAISHGTEGTYDVRITSGGSVRFQQYATSIQMTELEVKKLQLRNDDGTFTIDLTPGAVSANRVLNVPVITGTDTLATLGLAATYSAIMTHSADIIIQDNSDLAMGTGSDGLLRLSTANDIGGGGREDIVLALSDDNQAFHITDKNAVGTDWDLANASDPTVYIHSNTTPITDYLRIGDHDGTTAYIDVVGGTTLALEIGGTTEATISTSGLTLPAGSDLIFSGTTGTNDINLTDSVADALSIVRGSTDMVVFDSNTPAITITPATTITGLITSAGGITFGANADIAMTGTTGTNDFVLTNGLADALSITDGAADVLVIDTSTTGNVMTFTSAFTVSGLVSVDDQTDSTSTTTGSIHTDGGVGIAKDLVLGSASTIFLGDTANGNMTAGATIYSNNDDQIFTLKTGMTSGLTTIPLGRTVETDDFLTIGRIGSNGGVYAHAIAESGEAVALYFEGWVGSPTTTDTSASISVFNFHAGQHNGSNADADMADNSNLISIGEIDQNNARITRFLLKADDGELHLGVTTIVGLDNEDDVQLVRAMQKSGGSQGIIENQWDNPFYDYDYLHSKGLAGPKDDDGFFLFPLQSRLYAHEGAIWQLYTRLRDTEARLAMTEQQLLALGGV